MRVEEALKKGAKVLQNLDRPLLESELLLSFVLQKERIYLHTHSSEEIGDCEKFFELIEKRASQYPLEYITNEVSFFGEIFFIDSRALIPRPESELLVSKALEIANMNKIETIAEIGVGSGIISIMLKKYLPHARVIATDISEVALEVAEINCRRFEVDVELRVANLLDGVDENIDMIISNPPYIKNSYNIPKNLEYEPQNALFGGECGAEILKEIIDLSFFRGVKFLVCEMGYDQKEKMMNFLAGKKYKSLEFYKDYSGYDRGFCVEI